MMQRETSVDDSQQKHQKNITPSEKLQNTRYQFKKDVVIFVLKQSILESGIEAFEMVTRSLFEKYRCEISDCFERPDYLSDVLRYVFDASYVTIMESIKKSLDKFSQEGEIKEFLDRIRLEPKEG